MELFQNEEHSPNFLTLKNKSAATFTVVWGGKIYEIPAGGVFRCPASHHSCVAQQAGYKESIEILDTSRATTDYLESEKRRAVAIYEAKKEELARASEEMKSAERALRVATARADQPEPPAKGK